MEDTNSPSTASVKTEDTGKEMAVKETRDSSLLLPFERTKRQVLVKRPSETSEKYGCLPEKRPVRELLQYGIVNVDKPSGPSSHQVSAYVKQILGVDKSGHSGTLDPKVTGCLPVASGKGTRVVQSLLTAGKEYVCVMHIHKELPIEKVREAMEKFKGKIKQLPPIRSAVKRQWRFRNIYYMELLDIEGKNVVFVVGSQAGTYIRKLVHDIGQELGVGAHMLQLRRTKAGPFNESNIVKLQDLADAMHYLRKNNDETLLRRFLLPFESGVEHLPKIWVMDSTVDSLCHGASLKVPGIAKLDSGMQKDDPVAVLTLKGELVSVGVAQMSSEDILKNAHGIAAVSNQVLMDPGIYPRMPGKS